MAASRTTSPNGKWRRPSHRQRPPTPSVRLQEEAGCHNDLASAVPAGRPMMSTISNTFADYNIDDEEEEESSSVEGEDDGADGGDERRGGRPGWPEHDVAELVLARGGSGFGNGFGDLGEDGALA